MHTEHIAKTLQAYIEQVELLRGETWQAVQEAQLTANRLTVITCQLDLLIREMRATKETQPSFNTH